MSDPDTDTRPDPDALLELASREGEGRLKIFLGAAPGVGKTYAMLQSAQRAADDGQEVVVGLVETHGRAETEALTKGLEILPRRQVEYRGQTLLEFDIDAALKRRPRLLLIDELAHTNAPDSRHPKRWQDVKEILEAGIDVWTTLNIQHLESLADVVTRITGVAIRETVPDTILEDAEDVVLVDITPGELIDRLKSGKVYMPQTARRAMENFFTPSNLTALRELALRRTADRVDDQVVQLRRQKAADGAWATSERLLVCVGADPRDERLVRQAARLATSLNAEWRVVSLARPGNAADPASERATTAILTLAETLGAETQRLTSIDFTTDILRIATRENTTQIVLGRRKGGRLGRLFARSLPSALLQAAGDIGILIVPLADAAAPTTDLWTTLRALRGEGLLPDGFAALLATSAGVLVGLALDSVMELPNLSMVFLGGVLACSFYRGTRSAVFAAVLSFLGYNFFFTQPYYTLTIARPHELLALLFFLVIAILTGSLTGRIRKQAQAALAQTRSIEAQVSFSRKLAVASTEDEVLLATVSQVHSLLGGGVVILMPAAGELKTRASWPPDEIADPGELTAARWALEKREPAGWRTATLPSIRLRFLPLESAERVVAVLGFQPKDRTIPLPDEYEVRLKAVSEQAAVALDRTMLVREAVKAAALAENEVVRDALLASLSHDLRTPLASITGSVTTLLEPAAELRPEQQTDLLSTIRQEAGRLSRFVTNLLEMSRIESGAIKMKRDWVDVGDAIRIAADRSAQANPGGDTQLSLAPDLAFVRGDQDLLAQVIFNLLDNAHKYGDDGTVRVHARNEADEVVISVTDEGPGIRPADLERVFEKFYRAGGPDRRKPGTGLGLSICRGLVQAMGGTIRAESPAARRRGTRMTVRLPAARVPAGATE